MRVLSVGSMYPPHYLGGYELMWRSWVRAMRDGGDEVRVLASDMHLDGAAGEEDPDVHRELRWYWHDHEFPRLGARERLGLERHNHGVLERHLREFSPDVVNWWAMGGMSMALLEQARRAGLPAVGIVVDEWMVYGPKVDQWQRAASRFGPLAGLAGRLTGVPAGVDLGATADWLFVSETVRRNALESGLDLPRTTIAHGGIDPALYREAPEQPWRWRLLCLGRLDRRKGVHVAIRALAELPAEATLHVVGGGDEEYAGELRELVDELGLGERVRFSQPSRAELPAIYADADALLFPVLWEEPWGLVPLEAMAVGTPVIATGTGGSGEYLRDGENALIYGPGDDTAALTAAVRRLAGDAELRSVIRKDGLATAARHPESAFNDSVREALTRALERR